MPFSATPDGELYGGDFAHLYAMPETDDESDRFFREISRKFAAFFARVEKEPENAVFPEDEFESMTDSAPPMRGREYLSQDFFKRLFILFRDDLCKEASERSVSPCEIIRAASDEWRDVGRVAFHLAENKNAATREAHPFVFLATFISRPGANSTPRHLPLASAFKTFAADKTTLTAMLRPIEKAAVTSAFLRELYNSKRLFRPCEWNSSEAYNFVHDADIFKGSGIVVRYANLWKKASAPHLKANVVLDIGRRRGGLGSETLAHFSVTAAAGDTVLTESELAEILKAPSSLIRIKGEWVDADTAKVAALMKKWNDARDYAEFAGLTFMQSLRLLARANIRTDNMPDAPLDDELVSISTTEAFRETFALIAQKDVQRLPVLKGELGNTLRPYQRSGVSFLLRAAQLGCGVCLADDMGLGKTLQTIAFISILLDSVQHSGNGKILIVVPASLLENWKREFEKFAPWITVRILHPSAVYEPPAQREADVFITTYSMLTRESQERPQGEFTAAILDEAQNIKNPASRQSLAARNIKAAMRIALTGTPVENSLTDLWSIFDFINPGLLGSSGEFREYIKRLEEKNKHCDYSPLARLVKPFILRRMKNDPLVAPDLPSKCEIKAFCHLTAFQIRLYAKLADDLKKALATATDTQRSALVLSSLTQFKQLCNHPSQFTGNTEYLPERSGKFLRLREIASEIAERGEKVIVFTQFRELTDHLAEFLAGIFGRSGLILHGGTPVGKRMELVNEFQKTSGPPFFVITVKAGGTGLNLTRANHVIHFDRWWNPAAENQATDRAHRIGQKNRVIVHKLITKGTLEEKIDTLISGKKYLADSILAEHEYTKLIVDMNNDELMKLVTLSVPENTDI